MIPQAILAALAPGRLTDDELRSAVESACGKSGARAMATAIRVLRKSRRIREVLVDSKRDGFTVAYELEKKP